MSNEKSNGKGGKPPNGESSYRASKRLQGEPPARFPYDREIVADVMAWSQASPNFYMGAEEVPYSRARYRVVIDPSMTDVAQQHRVRPELNAGAEPEPLADPEDTDEVLADYLRWRRRYGNQLHRMKRQHLQGEPRPGCVTSIETAHNARRPGGRAGIEPGFQYRPPKRRF